MKPSVSQLADQRGFTLLMVLVAVVVIGLAAGMAGRLWSSLAQQVREEELLFRGDQYRRAIESYCSVKQGGAKGAYPTRIEDLLKDPRSPGVRRHLRFAYPDPFTGEPFELVRAGGEVKGLGTAAQTVGGIKGVRSASTLKPFKEDGFPIEYETFRGATSYAKWEFSFDVTQTQTPKMPTATPKP